MMRAVALSIFRSGSVVTGPPDYNRTRGNRLARHGPMSCDDDEYRQPNINIDLLYGCTVGIY